MLDKLKFIGLDIKWFSTYPYIQAGWWDYCMSSSGVASQNKTKTIAGFAFVYTRTT